VRRQRGFTLVELVLVIVLTLILTSGAIKGLRGIGLWRSAAAVGRVQADILYARNQALLSARRTLCVFDLQQQTFEIQQESVPTGGAFAATVIEHPLTSAPWRVVLADLASGLSVSSLPDMDNPTFGFGPDGTPLKSTGARVSRDIDVTFNNGARLTIFAGSGLSEVRWP